MVQSDDPSLLKQSDKHIEGFLIEDIWAELKRGRALRCSSCRRPGACIGCSIKKCSVKGHLPCIYKTKGVAIFESEFPVFCHRHRPHQTSVTQTFYVF
ncbi:unnamed protein product [Protopolystoma xenopodis]|uniref:PHD-type domain-containing protein n=1 Tax=Protopolystoma xenopodis TaxID=117903 RepID=A0A448X7G8_9PLAT|nr:unnamed protein product [Protopolystoma xenopodis]